ncbi:MAG: histidinol phosphatase [Propionibacteriaceae bacterium]|jgi:histidinol-phosphatase|nr:histidinol phosphatase [Propionibacteriaceae bacterium]
MADYTDDLRFAHLLADNADSIALARFKAHDLQLDEKPDHTWVTDADKSVEETIRKMLATSRPRDAIHGEEMDDTGYGPRRWVIDPIDGTHNYMRGVPVWATLIGLMIDGEVRVGVVSAPSLGRRWWASEGTGAYVGKSLFNATKLHVSNIQRVEDSFLSYGEVGEWIEEGRGQQFVDLMRDCNRTRAFGDFWHYMMVAEGAIDIACEPDLALYDMAALDVIVREAGGRFTNLDGQDGPVGPGALATNGLLHDEVLARLAVHAA